MSSTFHNSEENITNREDNQSFQPSQETPPQIPASINTTPPSQIKDNSIFIGKKPIKNYLGSIKLQLKKPDSSQIILKARGKFISKAVDIAELAKRNPAFALKTKDIKINTEEYQKEPSQNPKEKQQVKVSTIEIQLSKI